MGVDYVEPKDINVKADSKAVGVNAVVIYVNVFCHKTHAADS